MAETTEIAWTDSTFNPWIGCTKIGPGCDNCYAKADFDDRKHRAKWGAGNPRSRTSAENWKKPMQWNNQHEAFFAVNGRKRRVFCSSLADVFDKEVDPQWRYDLFNLILSTPNLDWLLLTKRIGNAKKMIEDTLPDSMKALPDGHPLAWPWSHVWLGATICNQEEADRDIPKLLAIPAEVRFLSMEPLLGAVDLDRAYLDLPHAKWIDWVIVGGESGAKARPMNLDWARSLRDQCAGAGVPFLFKQWGEHDHRMILKGKKVTGRLLDGVLHDEFPKLNQ